MGKMRRPSLLFSVIWAAFTQATPHFNFRLNSSAAFSTTVTDFTTVLIPQSSSTTSNTPPTSDTTVSAGPSSPDTTTPTSSSSSETTIIPTGPSSGGTSNSSVSSTQLVSSFNVSRNITSTSLHETNTTTPAPTVCTGCVIEALWPTTLKYNTYETIWSDVKVTETVLNRTITYMDGTAIDTVITEFETLTHNMTQVLDSASKPVTHTTPVFTWVPAFGTTITLNVGPTYVAYTNIYGGLDFDPPPMETGTIGTEILVSKTLEPTCDAQVSQIPIRLINTQDYKYFIQTYWGKVPSAPYNAPMTLPKALIEHLQSVPEITSIFNGSDIATCTLRPTSTPPESTRLFSSVPFAPPAPPSPPGMIIPTTSTYISKTYESTSTHITRQGCLRCSMPKLPVVTPESVPQPSKKPDNTPQTPNGKEPPKQTPPPGTPKEPQPPGNPKQTQPPNTQQKTQSPNNPQQSHAPHNSQAPSNPQQSQAPPEDGQKSNGVTIRPSPNDPPSTPNPQPHPSDTNQHITIGDSVFQVHPTQPTQSTQPNQQIDPSQEQHEQQQQQKNPGIVIGSQTLSLGQTFTINGVDVIVPSQFGGSSIVVGGSTVAINPAPTGPLVLTFGDSTATANPQGLFVVGTQILTPGGSPITVDGSTISLGPSGTDAVVNGVTQTLGNAPLITPPPVLTVDGQTISATVIGGTTQFVLGKDQTLLPGGVLTVDGTTFSLPKDGSGSTVVINGVTSTLDAPGLPVITLNSQSITASILDGTTEFVLGPGQTLTPGGAVTVSGTTFSMPLSALGSVVVVNGVTSTLNAPAGLPVLTLNGQSVTASVVDGTTAFILGRDQTLTPGGILTVSGTTFSMPASASGSVILINGVTSTFGQPPITSAAALTIDGKTYSATVRDSITEYLLGEGTTLRPGEAITISGTTYSLDPNGTALVINGKTSSIPKMPSSNSASTTKAASTGVTTSGSGSSSSSTTSSREPGSLVASGTGTTDKPGNAMALGRGLDRWVEGLLVGVAGWLLILV